jgi:2-amino-4-hydroxy-6-hydroxymethyldihydropteridine diphosphokinase
MITEKHALVAFGANLDFGEMTPAATISSAITEIRHEGLNVLRLSRLFQTPCFPHGAGPDYVNAAAVVTLRHNLDAKAILAALHRIEAKFGRERQQRWGMRTLDIDLLAVGESILPDLQGFLHWRDLPADAQARLAPEQLILPHPRLQDRAFVLVPLADVAPEWRHPVSGLTVLEMLAKLPAADRDAVVPLPDGAAV